MSAVRNILFIMCDQLRADYLSCAGHPTLETPNIDGLAQRSVRFDRAYCQAPVCGPSRMSFYTGRYMFSHGSTYNGVPLNIGELTIGDYLRPLGMRVALVGKTHMTADNAGMRRVGLDPNSNHGVLIAQGGFEPFERDEGLIPYGTANPDLAYNKYLNDLGYGGDNPWHDYANSAEGPNGETLSGWHMRNARLPARVKAEYSETPYMTSRAMDFIEGAGDEPWCLHLSYIKPHWPYMAPAPYNDMYGPNQILPPNRHPQEREAPHPVVAAFMNHDESVHFQSDEARHTVIPTYMGLVKQIDDEMGRLLALLSERGLMENTLIVFTSDHGDYLGDHWLGEKDLFHEESARIPLILYDPDPAADQTRGSASSALVEAIDLVPTFVDAIGGEAQPHRLEGRSLLVLTRGKEGVAWRDAVFSEADYAFRGARHELGLAPDKARAFMVRTDRYKYILYEGFESQLFDLRSDPNEFEDLGTSGQHEAVRSEMHERMFEWLRARRRRTTISDQVVEARTDTAKERGFLFGVW